MPGLSSIPILRRLFGNTETNVQKTDIVLTLTPHIIRIPDITEDDLLPLWIGTEQNIKLRGADQQSAFATTPFDEEETPDIPGIPEPRVEEAPPSSEAPPAGTPSSIAAPGPVVAPSPVPAPSPAAETPAEPRPEPEPQPQPAAPPPASGGRTVEPAPAGPAIVSLNPALITTRVGQEFTVSVTIADAAGVGSVPFHLRFDPQMLEFVGAGQASPFLGRDGAQVFVLAALGGGGREVVVGLSRPGDQPGLNGGGVLLTLTFRALSTGRTLLDLTDLSVLGPSAQPMPVESRNMNVVIQ